MNLFLDSAQNLPFFPNFAVAASGALAGAFCAFWLEDRHRQRVEAEQSRSRLLKAQFILGQKINCIANTQITLKEVPVGDDGLKAQRIPLHPVPDDISLEDLELMIDGRWAEEAAEILRADSLYRTSVELLETFNGMKIDLVRDVKTEVLSPLDGESAADIKANPLLVFELNSTFLNFRTIITELEPRLHKALEALRKFMEETFPKRRTIRISISEETGSDTEGR